MNTLPSIDPYPNSFGLSYRIGAAQHLLRETAAVATGYWIAQPNHMSRLPVRRRRRYSSGRGLASAMLYYTAEDKTMKVKTNVKAGVVISIIAILIC